VSTFGSTVLTNPIGIAVDYFGAIYVTDDYSTAGVVAFSPQGSVLTQWGSPRSGLGQFWFPEGVAIGPDDIVIVVDRNNDRVEEFSERGTFVRQWGRLGSRNGEFQLPCSVATNRQGKIYVTDEVNSRIQKFSAHGVYLAQWSTPSPCGIALDENGNAYVSSSTYRTITSTIQMATRSCPGPPSIA
jgi:DNA-binding beta-propeller fold protein YncE